MKQSILLLALCLSFTWNLNAQVILDFETAENSLFFQYFGSGLDGSLSTAVPNPNTSGINSSAMVGEFRKPAGAETWAGGFANPAPTAAVDATDGGQICVKVHFDHIGNLALKLESPNEGENWVTTQANTTTGEWEEICFNFSDPSLEDANLPAAGRTFGQMVFFFDFGISPDADQVYYFDDITYTGTEGGGATRSDVTFSVDMNGYDGDFGQVYVSGTLNGWAGDANPLEDADGDGVWSGTIPLDNGAYLYKFTLDNWAVQEEFEEGAACTETSGGFTNRAIEVSENTEVCYNWNTCDACGNDGSGEVSCSTIYDFEAAETTTAFQYFGSGLDGTLANIIANPDASGLNTSANVTEYIKGGDAQTWAGAFANPAPSMGIDAINGGQICVKTHFDHIGNLAVKLEASTTGGEDWITMVENTAVNQWEELCFDLNAPSIEGSNLPATGHAYAQIVLFFDFGTAGTGSDVSYYFDDISLCKEDVVVPDQDITFSVDMNNYDGDFGQVYISGTMNGWAGDANALTDADSDGVWETTLTLPAGVYEYKFTIDNWTNQEFFNGSETCTILTINDDGRFVNRLLNVTSSGESPATVCFNSCYGCGESAKITFNLGTQAIGAAESGVFLAGGAEFGAPNERFRLTDEDGDGVFSITIERELGYSTYYTFTNGNCPDFSCKENIAGQDCARPENFNDRFLEATEGDVSVNTCFAECTTDTECSGSVVSMITFSVDMSSYAGDFTTVYVSGTLNGWSGDANPLEDMGNGLWSAVIEVPNGSHEYKFTLDNWAGQEEFAGGEDCTVSDPSGQFTNRGLEVDGDTELCYIFNTCSSCIVGLNDLSQNDDLFRIQPTLVNDMAQLHFANELNESKQIDVFNIAGQRMQTAVVEGFASNYQLPTSHLESGIYVVVVQTETMIATKRIVKQ